MVKKVDSSVYNQDYFQGRYGSFDVSKIKETSDFDHIYQKAGSMIKIAESDRVVDLGCGTGQMAFYLEKKYGCFVEGIDYSETAIEICNSNLSKVDGGKDRIKFILASNEELPDFQEIRAVFMIDVIEHLFDEEIDLVLEKIKKWAGEKGIYLIIHTDNNNYLKFIRPITDFISVLTGKSNLKRVKREKKIVMEGHVNLTTLFKLKKRLMKRKFKIIKAEYPQMDFRITKGHLGPIGKNPIIFYPIYFLGKILFFLRPTFYLVAKYED
jgi:ubiquinone/menaquinone biosynthesis C-methylase UbiE